MNDLAKQLEILIAAAPRLRANFQSLTVGEISMVMLAPEPEVPAPTPGATEKQSRDLDDAVTYGLPEGAEVPGFRRPDGM